MEIIPAILTNNKDIFKTQLQQVAGFGAETVQIDFTDDKFVESKTLLPDEIDAFVLSNNDLVLEAHLMVENPEQYLPTLYTLGFTRVSAHIQTLHHPEQYIKDAKALDLEVGIAINPEIDLEEVEPYVNDLDFILFLTVVPGEQGHPFETQVLNKIHLEHVHVLKKKHKDIIIEVDGSINKDTILSVIEAGAERAVIGSGIWTADDPKEAYKELKSLAT